MKLLVVLMLCALAAAAPGQQSQKQEIFSLDIPSEVTPETQNILVNLLIRQFIEFLRLIINNGSSIFGIPPLDPLDLEHIHLQIPAGLINLDLELKNVYATGFGGFVFHRSVLNLRDLTFDIDVSIPELDIKADEYDFLGDLFTAIPLFGKGKATFLVKNFRLQAIVHLKQSEDGASVLIDRVENARFQIPSFKSGLTGVIGGGDIDNIVNAIIEEVFIDYINRFQGAIAAIVSHAVVILGNPILDQLDSWRFIAPLIPNN